MMDQCHKCGNRDDCLELIGHNFRYRLCPDCYYKIVEILSDYIFDRVQFVTSDKEWMITRINRKEEA